MEEKEAKEDQGGCGRRRSLAGYARCIWRRFAGYTRGIGEVDWIRE